MKMFNMQIIDNKPNFADSYENALTLSMNNPILNDNYETMFVVADFGLAPFF